MVMSEVSLRERVVKRWVEGHGVDDKFAVVGARVMRGRSAIGDSGLGDQSPVVGRPFGCEGGRTVDIFDG